MLGVTSSSEDKGKTEAWVAKLNVQYAYGYFKDRKLSKDTGHRGYPHAALFDPSGEIVWSGHPNSLSNGTVEKALKGASPFLSYGWAKPFHGVAKSISKSQFAKAIKDVDRMVKSEEVGAEAVRAHVQRILDARLKKLDQAVASGDFLRAKGLADALDGNLSGLDAEGTVDEVIAHLKKDKTAKLVLKGQRALAKLKEGDLRKKKNKELAMGKADMLAKRYEGTIVERQAREFIELLRAQL